MPLLVVHDVVGRFVDHADAALARTLAYLTPKRRRGHIPRLHKAWPTIGVKAFESGCRDLNPGPLDPQSSALTKLRHSPYTSAWPTAEIGRCQASRMDPSLSPGFDSRASRGNLRRRNTNRAPARACFGGSSTPGLSGWASGPPSLRPPGPLRSSSAVRKGCTCPREPPRRSSADGSSSPGCLCCTMRGRSPRGTRARRCKRFV
jgi:hypothetical protein